MKVAASYVKLVEWSEEDQCFVGSCPGLFYGGCHGEDEKSVFGEVALAPRDIWLRLGKYDYEDGYDALRYCH